VQEDARERERGWRTMIDRRDCIHLLYHCEPVFFVFHVDLELNVEPVILPVHSCIINKYRPSIIMIRLINPTY